jgi:hypothetical protein
MWQATARARHKPIPIKRTFIMLDVGLLLSLPTLQRALQTTRDTNGGHIPKISCALSKLYIAGLQLHATQAEGLFCTAANRTLRVLSLHASVLQAGLLLPAVLHMQHVRTRLSTHLCSPVHLRAHLAGDGIVNGLPLQRAPAVPLHALERPQLRKRINSLVTASHNARDTERV